MTTVARTWNANRLPPLVLLGGLALLLLSSVMRGGEPATEQPRLALLIGVAQYPGLGVAEQLSGSANDITAMRQLLHERFGFSEMNITTLIDQQATGSEIRGAMRALSDAVRNLPPGVVAAQVVVHFSGHGSQIPDQASGPDRDEDDGLDETWVPYDATRQGGNEDIRDDEINQMIHRICDGGKARLLIIFDGCHSGTGARGATKVRQLRRDLSPTQPSPDAPATHKQLPDGAVFLSACRAGEVEPEFTEDDKTYGLLTRFLVQTLSEEPVISRLSYDLMQKAIVAAYQRQPGVMQAPVPQLEGDPAALQKTILGCGPDVDRKPYYRVESTSSSRVLLRAGKFHNVTVGSLFELYERPEQIAASPDEANSSLAWLRISRVAGTTSEVEVIRWEDDDHTKSVAFILPTTFKGGFAILRHYTPGAIGLRVKVVQVTGPDSDSTPLGREDPKLPQVIADALTEATKPGETKWLNWITQQDQPCDLLLRMDGHYAALFPATGFAEVVEPALKTRGDVPASLRGGWGPFDLRTGHDNSDPPQTLTDYLRRITKVRNLISLAQSGVGGGGAADYNVKLELLCVDYDFDEHRVVSNRPWETDQEGLLTLREKDVYGYRLTNQQRDGKPIYVTVLELSPTMGIQVVIPNVEAGDERETKLQPGEDREVALHCGPLAEDDPPYVSGTHYAVLLVTREPADFSFVAQSDLPKSRGAPLSGGAADLTDQLAEVAFFTRSTRGGRLGRKKSDTSWHAQVLSWRTTQ